MLRKRKVEGIAKKEGGSGDLSSENQKWDAGEKSEKPKQGEGKSEVPSKGSGKDSASKPEKAAGKDSSRKLESSPPPRGKKHKKSQWGCVDTCCWLIGYVCVTWWALMVLYNALPSLPQYVTEAITGPLPDPPGVKLAKEGMSARHPVVFVPGIVTGGLELWEGHPCADGLFRKRLWGGTFGEVYKRPYCWMDHMRLDNETGLDPAGVRVRPVSGLVAADYFAPGYFVWAVLIENLARIGYEERNMHMAAYDWRLSFQNTEVRDKSLSRLKSTIESLVQTNNARVVVIPHSMGSLYFLHFLKWVETPAPMGGGGGFDWCARHIKAVVNIAGPLLGVPKAFTGLFSAEAKDIAVARAVAPGVLESELFGLQTLQHMMRVTRSWDATMSMIPKGGEKVWGDAEWSPEEGFDCSQGKNKSDKAGQEADGLELGSNGKPYAHYGRMVAFGKESAQLPLSMIIIKEKTNSQEMNEPVKNNVSCGDVWTEYHELNWSTVEEVPEKKLYTASTILDLLEKVAPRMMQRAFENWSYGVAEKPSDPKYQHHKYWSNPFETTLPNAPDMEMYCLYGVGVLTERSYIYKLAPRSDSCSIPFRIDASVDGDSAGCLKGGVHMVDGDETVPALSSGYMCAKGWRGKTRYNPHNLATHVREYQHAPPTNLLEGRGTQSGAHVDIMGNFALIEDIVKIAAGATGDEIGGDRIYSNLLQWSDRIKVDL